MISTVLANMGKWSDAVLAAVAIGVVVTGCLLAVQGRRGRRAAGVLALLTTLAALALALTPESGGAGPTACYVGDAVPRFADTANIALLFPAAFFAVIAVRRPLPVLAAGSGLSAAIELVQASAAALGRSCDLNDWYTNTAGVVAAVLLAAVITALVRRSGRASTTTQDLDARAPARAR